ncbi:hypothetical protein E6P09_14125 [Haloferax mediterranei ATCC 33500]|uniref:DUF5518 domain-containing protein n=1 Tax=Haloferax mediterranei (strain ATCC 33500 / DSM 1411 / JCM 8866 / NBRC 14739 / NCIMB 2177 / R-4) TaxID=523841 RepID=I3R7J8_HALMT|nr:hypothetical protein [Haloferax mediterranei]AFK20208.1 hypothetical protein HFX_2526 [Haloferax mediterranei ATCC 33500]AHZ23583.1 hypothetical protein BM92_13455 [Haloferax mediterranei ATCC 33500]ELZ99067.1 hypothetical protein C439_14449 [Haloferax mediterranei ATCC 33500]MDX5987035.1 hypothetical protein [Haloferax mediterranei ATCC 33500]QCQ76353.1 hypothetical protein E6P09_14125 [Haloferax mediterranei ATCC 33500]
MQRSDQKESERSVDDILSGLNSDDEPTPTTQSAGGNGGRFSGLFSPRAFLAALLLSVGGLVVGGAIPIIGFFGRFAGIAAVGFLIGLVGSKRRYAEVGLAGAIAAGLAFVISTLFSVFAPFAVQLLADYGIAIAGVGALSGGVAGLVGHYFGRDLRSGLTQDL